MTQSYRINHASHVLTLEEITNLTEEEGKPADTLMNVVALIATGSTPTSARPICLEPDRSNLVLAATLGLHPRCIGTLRMPLNEGLTGLVAEQVLPVAVDDVKNHPRYKYFIESGEEYLPLLPWCASHRPWNAAGCFGCSDQGSPRSFGGRNSHVGGGRKQVAPVVSEARTLDRFIAPPGAPLVPGPQSLVELGPRLCQPLSRSESKALAPAESESNLDAQRNSFGEIERRATELVLHSRVNYVYRRQQEYLQADRTWGAAQCRRPAASPSRLFLRRVWTA